MIRLDGQDTSMLLGRTVNYAAESGEAGFIEFIGKGIFGGFPGRYTVTPYYERIADYTYKQSRDVYEYRLNLDDDQIAMLTDHLYELDQVVKPYYFFSSNCSYHVLYLIDAACQDERLVTKCKPWVIPYDTVSILDETGLIDAFSYRPAIGSILAAHSLFLSKEETKWVRLLAEGEKDAEELLAHDGLGETGKAAVLDCAVDHYLFTAYPKLDDTVALDAMMARVVPIARARSTLDAELLPVPEREDPLKGHAPFCLETGGGYGYGRVSGFFRLRPSYHEFSDPGTGHTPGGEIVFPSLTLSYRMGPDGGRYLVEEATVLRITSLKMRSHLLKPVSWQADLGMHRDRPRTGALGPYASYMAGGAWLLGTAANWYLLGGGYASYAESGVMAPQTQIGMLMDTFLGGRFHLYLLGRYYLPGNDGAMCRAGSSLALPLTGNTALIGEGRGSVGETASGYGATLSLRVYF